MWTVTVKIHTFLTLELDRDWRWDELSSRF